MKRFHSLFLILLLGACDESYDFKYNIIITETATNLGTLNSADDDYNSDLPYPSNRMEIYFSSNRMGDGDNFNIVSGLMDFSYHSKDDVLDVKIVHNEDPSKISETLLSKVNTRNNEFGPYTYYSGEDMLFMYASGTKGNYAINFVEFTNWNRPGLEQKISKPFELSKINDAGENLYPSLSSDKKTLFFCSNRNDSVFNIYSAKYNSEINKESLLEGNITQIEKHEQLSSPHDDKCPYIKDNFLVFASNRPGGFGGYDLWYARFENNSWSAPVNFGEKINSEHDEFRPVIFENLGFNLMIFSSNRPGGQGGFDLYMAKTENLRN